MKPKQGPILFQKESIQLNSVSQNHEADAEPSTSTSAFCFFDLVINWMLGTLVRGGNSYLKCFKCYMSLDCPKSRSEPVKIGQDGVAVRSLESRKNS